MKQPNFALQPAPGQHTDQLTDRLHAIDAIRAAALLLGVCLHASLSFVPGLDLQLWPISDSQKSVALTLAGFVIHVFRMSVFFLVAGFLARVLLQRLGTRAFVYNRAQRILVPLALAWVVCFVLIVAVALWALARANGGHLPDPLPVAKAQDGLNFLHLWFLYVLLWLYALALAVQASLRRLDPRCQCVTAAAGLMRLALSSVGGTLLLALPVGIALMFRSGVDPSMGVPTPAYSLIPPVAPLFIYGYVFVLGWLMNRNRALLDTLARRWQVNLVLGLVAVLICLKYLAGTTALERLPTAPYALCYGLALVGCTLGFVGLGLRYLHRPSPRMRYLADASYWMYIAHLPLVMALQTAFMLLPWHWAIKYGLINGVCVAVLLLTYHWGVRNSWLGQLLNGSRKPR